MSSVQTGLWLIKESGRVPACGCARCGRGAVPAAKLRRSYMVLRVEDVEDDGEEGTMNFFAELSGRRLELAVGDMIRQVRAVQEHSDGFSFATFALWESILRGMFASEDCEECNLFAGQVCAMCLKAGPSVVEQEQFEGCFPNASAPWWTGVTDAGYDSRDGMPWLFCRLRRYSTLSHTVPGSVYPTV